MSTADKSRRAPVARPRDDTDDAAGTALTGRFAVLNSWSGLPGGVGREPYPSSREAEYMRMLKTLLGNVDGMVYRCRIDADWMMEFVSEGCVRVTGYSPRDLMYNGLVSYESITHAEDQL